METTTSNRKCRDCIWYEIERAHGSRSSGNCTNPDRIEHNEKFGRSDYIMKRCGGSPTCKNFKRKEEENMDKKIFFLNQKDADTVMYFYKKTIEDMDAGLDLIAKTMGIDIDDLEDKDLKKRINRFNIGDTVYIPAKITGVELKRFKSDGEVREYIVYKLDKTFNIVKEDEKCLAPSKDFVYRNYDKYKCVDTWTENMLVEAMKNG